MSLLALLLLLTFPPQGARPENKAGPDFSLKDTAGNHQNLGMYRGKIVVLNFWATWCLPCEAEMREFVDAYKKYGDQQVIFLAASLDDEATQNHIPGFVDREKMRFPILIGATPELMEKFGAGPGVPATIFIDRQGKMAARVLGPITRQELTDRIEWMLANKTGKFPHPLIDHSSD